MSNRSRKLLLFFVLVLAGSTFLSQVMAQSDNQGAVQTAPVPQPNQRPTLYQATVCEKVENLTPIRQGIVFSVSAGQVCCFTAFDPVPQPSVIYHRWFHRDELNTQTRLRLYTPKWTTYSVIQLRETDKGPWRVEISDQNGKVFDVLRFSITD